MRDDFYIRSQKHKFFFKKSKINKFHCTIVTTETEKRNPADLGYIYIRGRKRKRDLGPIIRSGLFLTNCVDKTSHMQRNEMEPLSYTMFKNQNRTSQT